MDKTICTKKRSEINEGDEFKINIKLDLIYSIDEIVTVRINKI